LPYFEAVHNHYFETFRYSYMDAAMEENFQQVLDQVRPDVIHVQQLHLHSIGYLDIAADRSLPIVYTLHEYMLMCLRWGLLLRPGLELCDGPEPEACARCARVLPQPDPDLTAELAAALPEDRRQGLAEAVQWLRRTFGLEAPSPEPASDDPYVAAVDLRLREIRSRLKKVDLFIAPSAFLRDRFIANGMVEPDRIAHSDYGFPIGLFDEVDAGPVVPGRLRVGFIGTIAE
ncbi:MAG: glycosyltransferase family 4 protein, partial [bacterium]|nr:glycosyltransferase family 4 protein [bacterium]